MPELVGEYHREWERVRSTRSRWEVLGVLVLMVVGGFVTFVLLVAVAMLFCQTFFPSPPYGLQSDEYREFKASVAPMIASIEKERRTGGRYHESLESIGVRPPVTRFGPWGYSSSQDGQWFALRLGDYRRNGFAMSWSSEDGDWHVVVD